MSVNRNVSGQKPAAVSEDDYLDVIDFVVFIWKSRYFVVCTAVPGLIISLIYIFCSNTRARNESSAAYIPIHLANVSVSDGKDPIEITNQELSQVEVIDDIIGFITAKNTQEAQTIKNSLMFQERTFKMLQSPAVSISSRPLWLSFDKNLDSAVLNVNFKRQNTTNPQDARIFEAAINFALGKYERAKIPAPQRLTNDVIKQPTRAQLLKEYSRTANRKQFELSAQKVLLYRLLGELAKDFSAAELGSSPNIEERILEAIALGVQRGKFSVANGEAFTRRLSVIQTRISTLGFSYDRILGSLLDAINKSENLKTEYQGYSKRDQVRLAQQALEKRESAKQDLEKAYIDKLAQVTDRISLASTNSVLIPRFEKKDYKMSLLSMLACAILGIFLFAIKEFCRIHLERIRTSLGLPDGTYSQGPRTRQA